MLETQMMTKKFVIRNRVIDFDFDIVIDSASAYCHTA